MSVCLSTSALSHHFGRDRVLHDVHLQVPRGAIYGFLGPNGAGKTTTLRLVLGLLPLQHGEIEVFGLPFEQHRIEVLRRVGTLIESPSIYDHLSAVENLEVVRQCYGVPRTRIGEVLEAVGLSATGRKRTGAFSLGMKQRLALAIALLHEPELLVLDEPSNGLDPSGIIEMRELLRRLNTERGTTILVSSHLLAEIDRLVTHVGIINKGTLLFQGPMDELKSMQQRLTAVCVRTSRPDVAAQVIAQLGHHVTTDGSTLRLPPLSDPQVAELTRHLVHAAIDVHEVRLERHDLEAIFMDMVGVRA